MTPIVDPAIIKRLLVEIDQKYARLSDLLSYNEARVKQLDSQCNQLLAQRSHLETILKSQEVVEQSEQLLDVPVAAQAVEMEETMYLGATPDESLRGGGTVESTF